MTGIRAVIFDFDETLADTLPGRIAVMGTAVQQVLGHILTPEQTLAVIRQGSNLESQMSYLSDGDDTIAELLLEAYRQLYYDPGRAPLPLFPGMEEVLAALQTSGVWLALVTSRHRTGANGNPIRGVLWELQRMGLEGLFSVVVGYEDSTNHKPAPDPFLVCLEKLGIPGGDVIAIGDNPFDIIGARAAGISGAAGLWGTNDTKALLDSKPDMVLTTPADIVTLL